MRVWSVECNADSHTIILIAPEPHIREWFLSDPCPKRSVLVIVLVLIVSSSFLSRSSFQTTIGESEFYSMRTFALTDKALIPFLFAASPINLRTLSRPKWDQIVECIYKYIRMISDSKRGRKREGRIFNWCSRTFSGCGTKPDIGLWGEEMERGKAGWTVESR